MDEAEQIGESGVHLDIVEPQPFERPEFVFILGHQAGPEWRAHSGHCGDPGVAVEQPSVLAGDRFHPGAPRFAGAVDARHLPVDGVEHEVEQLGFARDVGVERHGCDAESGGDPAHGHRIEPGGVRQLDRGRDDLVDRPALFRATARRAVAGFPPQQFEGAGWVTCATAFVGHGNILSQSTLYDV